MKILFISSGNNNNGIGTVVKNQGESLKDLGLEVEYFTIKGKGIFSYIKHSLLLKRSLHKNSYEIFHAHYSLSGFTAAIAGCKPLVVSLMGSDTKSSYIQKAIIRILAKTSFAKLIVKSKSMLIDINYLKNIVILPNGVNLDRVKPIPTIHDPSTTSTVLFAADPLRPEKNYELAKNAFTILKKDLSAQLKVVYSQHYHKIIEEINNSSVLLLTSQYEGSPNIVKEAMACNCPIVSTDVGDVKWLFGNEPGHYITSVNPENVAEKLKLALSFAAIKVKTNGRNRIIELGLDSENVATKLKSIYEKVLHESN